jgi:hypothetical protein
MQKGLFSSLFLLTMIVLFTPTLIIPEQSRYVIDTYNHLNLLTLSADNVVKDALFEETVNGCSIKNQADYENKIDDYLSNLFDEFNTIKSFPFQCEYDILNTSLNVDEFSGNIEITCQIHSDYSLIEIKKELLFKNEINHTPGPTCNVVIEDIFDSSKEYVNISR